MILAYATISKTLRIPQCYHKYTKVFPKNKIKYQELYIKVITPLEGKICGGVCSFSLTPCFKQKSDI